MEEILSLILHGCKSARELESNLQNMGNQPNMLSESCGEIIRIFSAARERLNAQKASSSARESEVPSAALQIDANVEAWLRSNYTYTQAMDIIQAQPLAENVRQSKTGGGIQVPDSGGEDSRRAAASSSQRPRRRKDNAEKKTTRVAAPRIGNTEIPPEDGYTWRKYGQKEILGSRFPRGYYRCTHQKLYQCPAKKLVQRLDDDPYTFEVTYRDDHTCHMSSTAPSIPPPLPPPLEIGEMTQTITSTQALPTSTTSISLLKFMSMDFTLGGGGASGSSSSMVGGGGNRDGAGPSTTRHGKEIEYPVADMADVMFNSGSSSTNSLDLIFSSMEDKWEPKDKKK